jgi:hypothetical protein
MSVIISMYRCLRVWPWRGSATPRLSYVISTISIKSSIGLDAFEIAAPSRLFRGAQFYDLKSPHRLDSGNQNTQTMRSMFP